MDNTVKEPLIHLSKREDMASGKRWLVRIVAIFLSLVVCAGFIFMIIKMNPVEVYEGIVEGAVGTSRRFWVTARDALTLLCVAVAVTPAFKMKLEYRCRRTDSYGMCCFCGNDDLCRECSSNRSVTCTDVSLQFCCRSYLGSYSGIF